MFPKSSTTRNRGAVFHKRGIQCARAQTPIAFFPPCGYSKDNNQTTRTVYNAILHLYRLLLLLLIFFHFGGFVFSVFGVHRCSPPTVVASPYDNNNNNNSSYNGDKTTTNRQRRCACCSSTTARHSLLRPSVVVSASDGDIQRAQRRPVDHRQTQWHRTRKSRSLLPVIILCPVDEDDGGFFAAGLVVPAARAYRPPPFRLVTPLPLTIA